MSEVVSGSNTQEETHTLRERWRETAEASLKGAPLSTLNRESEPGLLIEPLYWGSTAPPESRRGSDAGRAGGSTLCARIDRGDWRGAQKLAMEAVEGGAAGLVIAWGGAGEEGVRLPHAAAVDQLLTPLWLEGLPLYIEPGRAPLEKASILMSALSSRSTRGAAPPALISLGIDPLGGLTRDGLWREPIGRLIRHSQELSERWGAAPWLRLFEVDEGVAHEAGADEAQGLAFTLSVALEYLRQIEAAGGMLDQIAPFTFHLRVDPRPFHAIAKLRAFRQLWARVSGVAGLAEVRAALRVSLSARSVSAVDPWVNLLRGTVSSFAALTAGVEAYEVPRFDLHYGAGPLGRRLSRNTGLILAEEGQLGRVED
ncbi:MAG: methylmalonyl-CoA mutase family protein, partial [Myxococcota bacterium]|nr:methylmalonyl-CoA mutase family protein [Myxococcota bacterium]